MTGEMREKSLPLFGLSEKREGDRRTPVEGVCMALLTPSAPCGGTSPSRQRRKREALVGAHNQKAPPDGATPAGVFRSATATGGS